MGKSTEDMIIDTLVALEKAHEPPTAEELAAFKKKFEGMSQEEMLAKLGMDQAVSSGKLRRIMAYGEKEFGVPGPSEKAIFKAYPHVSENFFVTVLTLGFNKVVNKRREKEFEEQDRKDFAVTGTTAALRISKDEELKKRDGYHQMIMKIQLDALEKRR